MEVDNPEPSEDSLPLGREIYISPEQIALAALVDEIDLRIFKPWSNEDE